jgi:hypothetical protein
MTSGEPSSIRIGTDDRTAAMAALDEHLSAGRLNVEEYGERSARAANAVFASDLAELFTDLPGPHPSLPGVKPLAPEPVLVHAVDPEPHRPGAVLERWGPRLVAASPILAVLLFVITRQWWVFLLIPLFGVLVYSGAGRRS